MQKTLDKCNYNKQNASSEILHGPFTWLPFYIPFPTRIIYGKKLSETKQTKNLKETSITSTSLFFFSFFSFCVYASLIAVRIISTFVCESSVACARLGEWEGIHKGEGTRRNRWKFPFAMREYEQVLLWFLDFGLHHFRDFQLLYLGQWEKVEREMYEC